ncbi:MAG: ABC transporter permease [Vallitaleaceae bacterium]|nr:ABC transporter permease [Vallitaleaceae bacterium]
MNLLTIVRNEIRLMLKNKVALVLLLLMPTAMIALMGNALKSMLQVEVNGVEQFQVLYLNEDESPFGSAFDKSIRSEGAPLFEFITPQTNDFQMEMKTLGYDEGILIPKEFNRKMSSNEPISIQHFTSGKAYLKTMTVDGFLNQYMAALKEEVAMNQLLSTYQIENVDVSAIGNDIKKSVGNNFFRLNELKYYGKTDSYQFFSISMLIFFLLNAGMGLGCGIIDDRNGKIFSRIYSFPITHNQYLLGKALGNAVISITQAIMVIVFSSLLFKVQWGPNYFGVGVVILLVILIASGISTVMSSLLNSSKALSVVLAIILWLITFMSGAFMPIAAFENISQFTMNKWALDAITFMMNGATLGIVFKQLILLCSVGISLWIIGVILYKRRAVNE